ncbi:DMSO/TMAO reductase YedYZ heme-binding membrane subunit [Acholeplasma morum]|uniref:ferric reductase-like transmembrane domain-containing protein n=1 Tax=Paracholeplasma morum TaxID=264637 RepID=UPI00195ECF6A|nr:ferric reductase-like transmembrane domain-containing protein [Paracholeplasma morum]MBM7453182.1 DMSO/TMAO reductase YedYZ heme-binding membrane subunit [Paracholeplasma morum]
MIVLAFLIILTILAMYAGKFIRKHNVKIYIVAVIVSILAFILQDKAFTTPIMQGFLGLSFFYIVMITGAIDKKHKIKAKFMGLRREFSIIGFIVISPHALNYTLQGLNGTRSLEWFGLISFVLMIPLFVTSFLKIRKKMKPKTWNLIQSAAYIIYLLLFIHLILNYTKTINLVLYVAIFGFYFVLKIIYEIKKIRTKKHKQVC